MSCLFKVKLRYGFELYLEKHTHIDLQHTKDWYNSCKYGFVLSLEKHEKNFLGIIYNFPALYESLHWHFCPKVALTNMFWLYRFHRSINC